MRTSRRRIVVGTVLVLAFAAALVVGVNIGLALGVMLDGPPRGAMALHHIAAIEAGKTKNTRIVLEHDVDMGLLWGYRFQQEPLRTFVEYFTRYPLGVHDDYLRRLANHRLKTPSPMRAEALSKEPAPAPERRAYSEQMLEGARENDAIIAEMVRRYAQDAEAKP